MFPPKTKAGIAAYEEFDRQEWQQHRQENDWDAIAAAAVTSGDDDAGCCADISARDECSFTIQEQELVDFKRMWLSQESFMRLLQKKRNFPSFPVDLESKSGQRLLKEIIHDCQDELGEARVLLKNTKNHRATEVKDFDRASYIEELIDSQKFLLEIFILSGITIEEFRAAFDAKTDINTNRIQNGY